jgi:hypothetical protein
MDTDVQLLATEETPVNGAEESSMETKTGKRKRASKKTEETNISNGRPRRTLPKRKFFFFLNYESIELNV